MVELKGSLNGIGLPAIVQLIAELHHSGSLELAKGAAAGMLGFNDGRLVIATFDHGADRFRGKLAHPVARGDASNARP